MSDIYALNEQFRKELLRMERAAASQMVREYGKAWTVIRRRILDLTTQYNAVLEAGETAPIVWLLEAERLTVLQRQVEGELSKFAQYAERAIRDEQKMAVDAAIENSRKLMQVSVPDGVSVSFHRLPKEAFKNLIGFMQDGSPLKGILDDLPGEAGRLVADGLQTGLLLGWNPSRTASHIRKGLGGNLVRALRIARTETMRSYREANREVYWANRYILKGWRWASARNERTCAMCWAMDGTVHGLDEQLEEHICGRCTMVPLTKSWRELGFDMDEVESQVPETGIEAFGQLFDTEQLKVLGPAKYAAWKEGRFNLNDLVGRKYDPQWGWTRYEKSLVELLGKEEARAYTRLALMGVAKNVGNYSVDDLVRIAGIGLRELTDAEVSSIVNKVGTIGLSKDAIQKVDNSIAGLEWNGKVLKTGDMISPEEAHYLKHVISNREWPEGTTIEQYNASLKATIQNPESGMFISKFDNNWQIGFVGESGKWQGTHGFSHILVEYRVKYNYWVTGFQPEFLEKQITDNRELFVWIKRLTGK